MDEAIKTARYYKELFGDFYIELQEHGIDGVRQLTRNCSELAKETGLPLVGDERPALRPAGGRVLPGHPPLHRHKRHRAGENRFKMAGEFGTYYLKSEDEMRALFPDIPEAIDNTWKIAEMCDLTLEFGQPRLPKADVPPGRDVGRPPRAALPRGARAALPGRTRTAPKRRLDYELDVVRQTGFADYILSSPTSRSTRARTASRWRVRGSAAASIILYTLGVTDIDPLEHRLVFERFLNIERKEMPDVDMDFAEDRRDEMIHYAAEKYGHDRVAQIITFGTLGREGLDPRRRAARSGMSLRGGRPGGAAGADDAGLVRRDDHRAGAQGRTRPQAARTRRIRRSRS